MELTPMLFENVEVRFIPEGDSFWVVGKDVLKALEYSDNSLAQVNNTFATVPEEWKGHNPIMTLGGEQKMLCLSEQGLYFFLGRSDKPKALPYQKWIAGEVVPSIRKTGEYVLESVEKKKPQGVLPTALSDAAIIFNVLYEGNQLALALDKIFVREHGYSALQTAEVQLIAPQQQALYTVSDIGKQVSPVMSGMKVNKALEAMGWQIGVRDHKNRLSWEAVGPGLPNAVYLDTGKQHSDGTPVRQLKWTADTIFAIQSYLNN